MIAGAPPCCLTNLHSALDVHPGNILSHFWHPAVPEDPVIERTLKISEEMYRCLVVPQPPQVRWDWADGQREAKDYEVKLCDLGTGTSFSSYPSSYTL